MIMLIFTTSIVFAADAVLSWDPNNEPDLAGYKVYYGTESGVYTNAIAVGLTDTPTAPQYTVSNLNSGTTYFFSTTSIDSASSESGFSNEVNKTFPAPFTDQTNQTDQTTQSLSSQNISGGCGMIRPGNGKPPAPGQAADIISLLVFLLIAVTKKRLRVINFVQRLTASFLQCNLKVR